MKHKTFPGSVFCRKGRKTLYIKLMGKEYPTGLKDNPLGRKIAMQMLEKLYTDFLVSGGALPAPICGGAERNIYGSLLL